MVEPEFGQITQRLNYLDNLLFLALLNIDFQFIEAVL